MQNTIGLTAGQHWFVNAGGVCALTSQNIQR